MLLSAFGRAAKEKEKNLLYNELDAWKQKKKNAACLISQLITLGESALVKARWKY